MFKMKFAAFLSSTIVFGCASIPKETAEGKSVKIFQGDVSSNCVELGSVEWMGEPKHSLSDAKLALREKTAAVGGNTLRLESLTMAQAPGGGSYPHGVGTAYKCPKE